MLDERATYSRISSEDLANEKPAHTELSVTWAICVFPFHKVPSLRP